MHSCEEDNETTARLRHTKWAGALQGRPLDIIATSSRLPELTLDRHSDAFVLGNWRGSPPVSTTETESILWLLMRAVDDVFDRAEATVAST